LEADVIADPALQPGGRRVIPAAMVLARSVSGPAEQVATGILGAPGAGWRGDVSPGPVAGVPGSVGVIGPVRCGGVPA
jgi:hypothetical protein